MQYTNSDHVKKKKKKKKSGHASYRFQVVLIPHAKQSCWHRFILYDA